MVVCCSACGEAGGGRVGGGGSGGDGRGGRGVSMLSVMGSIEDDDDVDNSDIHAVVYFHADGDDCTHHVCGPIETANPEAPYPAQSQGTVPSELAGKVACL